MESVNDVDSLSQLIFAPDPSSRFQHEKVHGVQKGPADCQPLRALMLAVLHDAIACFQGYFFKPSRTSEMLFQEAEEWINSNDDEIFSFNNICETLGLDPQRLRKGLMQWKAKQILSQPEERKRLILNKGKCAGRKKDAAQGPTPIIYTKPPKELASKLRQVAERR